MTLNLYHVVYFHPGQPPSRPIRWIWATDLASAVAEFLNHSGLATQDHERPPRVMVAPDGLLLVQGYDIQYQVKLVGKVADRMST